MGNGLSYFFLGLGIGAAGAMLLAPKNGVETRNYLRGKAQEGTDYMKRQGDMLMQQASESIEPLKQNVQRPITALADALDAGKRAYRENLQNSVPAEMQHT